MYIFTAKMVDDFYSGRQEGHVPLTTTLNGYKPSRAEFMIRRPTSKEEVHLSTLSGIDTVPHGTYDTCRGHGTIHQLDECVAISGSSRKNITYDDVGRMFRSYRGK